MDECDVVVAGDNVAEGGEPLLDALDANSVWEGVAEVLEFLICGRRGDEQTVSVSCADGERGTWTCDGQTCGHTANDACPCDGRVHDGDDICEFCLERRVKVGGCVHGGEAVAVCEFGEHADVAAVFKLDTWSVVSCVVR